jgi:hypothetical protein
MEQTQRISLEEIIEMRSEEISDFLVKANEDICAAELEEKFELCSFVVMTKELFLSAEAQVIASEVDYPTDKVLNILKQLDDYIYYSIKNSEFY